MNHKAMNNTQSGSKPERSEGSLERLVRAPDWLLEREKITQRKWRQMKRRDLRKLIAAFDQYRMGSAYCPGTNGEVGAIGKLLNELKESHSIKKWGR